MKVLDYEIKGNGQRGLFSDQVVFNGNQRSGTALSSTSTAKSIDNQLGQAWS